MRYTIFSMVDLQGFPIHTLFLMVCICPTAPCYVPTFELLKYIFSVFFSFFHSSLPPQYKLQFQTNFMCIAIPLNCGGRNSFPIWPNQVSYSSKVVFVLIQSISTLSGIIPAMQSIGPLPPSLIPIHLGIHQRGHFL